MAKNKTSFECSSCGHTSPKWIGKCPTCFGWNTFIEELIQKENTKKTIFTKDAMCLSDVEYDVTSRVKTDLIDFDRVLGGGIVSGSLILLGGAPGIGKSTLLLQICSKLGDLGKVLYVSGEESAPQIKLRADRIEAQFNNISLLCDTGFSSIEYNIREENPKFVILDSIQTMKDEDLTSPQGSISQIKSVTEKLMDIAKNTGITIFVIGHITKDGALAGPKVLEHMVDTVLYFEGDKNHDFRVLRSIKNRFGSTNEIALFEMHEKGLVEVLEPAHVLLEGRPIGASGTVIITSMEGTRPILMEIQALVSDSNLPMPRRMATGIDHNRVTLLIAVLEKKAGLHLHTYDTYVNVVGGLKVVEPACDLGVIIALASSFKNKPVKENLVIIGEVGLTGEVRAVSNMEKRLMEILKLGFKNCIIPKVNYDKLQKNKINLKKFSGISLIPVNDIIETLKAVF